MSTRQRCQAEDDCETVCRNVAVCRVPVATDLGIWVRVWLCRKHEKLI